ncbi:unnamed protein product [marine sediment metagenome]|uniref:Uncharacterized protein n=1 Tax=marine sediment metagenome TaxID=412755 RepID=X1G027_9ZZZZ
MAIDIGPGAIDRAASYGSLTFIAKDNPANATGTITSVEIWAETDLSDVEVATFYEVSPSYYSTRSTVAIGSVTAGSKQTFPISLDVQEGDLIGIYFSAGTIERDSSGYIGIWYKSGDKIPCENQIFSSMAGWAISLYGTGNGEGVTHEGAVTLSGVGTLTGIGRGIFVGKSTLSGIGTLASIGRLIAIGKTTLAGTGTLSALGGLLLLAKATLSGVGSLSAIGQRIRYGVASLAGTGSLAAKGVGIFAGKATLAGVGSLATVGRGIFVGAATLAGTGTLNAIGSIVNVAVGIQDKSPGMAAKLVAGKLI